MAKKRPDWILNSLVGNTTPEQLTQRGLESRDFKIDTADTYWGRDDVKSQFTPEGGAPDENAFKSFYATELENYQNVDRADNAQKGMIFQNPLAGKEQLNATQMPKVFTVDPDIFGRDLGYTKFRELSKPKVGWREVAVQVAKDTGVEMKDGSRTKLEEFEGDSIFFQKDGKVGLKEIDVTDELHSTDQMYNASADSFGMYSHETSATSLAGTVINSPLKFVGQTIDALAEFGKVFTDTGSEAEKDLIAFENLGKSLDWGMTEEGMNDFWSLENLANIGLQAGMQIGGMVLTGGGASLLTGSKTVGSVVGKTFMSSLIGGEVGTIAREAGLSKQETGLLMLGTMAATYPLMNLSEYAAKGIGLQGGSHAARETVKGFVGMEKESLKQLLKSKEGIGQLMNLAKGSFANGLETMASLGAAGKFGASAVAEGIEESAEEVVKTTILSGYDWYNNLIDGESFVAKGLGTNKKNNFFGNNFENFSWARFAEQVALAGAGGAIGGGLAGGTMKMFQKQSPQSYDTMMDWVSGGKADDMRAYVEKQHARGVLGTTHENENGGIDNDTAKDMIFQTLDQMESAYAAAGAAGMYTQVQDTINENFADDMEELGTFGANVDPKDPLSVTSLSHDIQELVKEKDALMAETDASEESVNRLNTVTKKISDLRSGKMNKHYVAQMSNYIAQKRKTDGVSDVISRTLGTDFGDTAGKFRLTAADTTVLNEKAVKDTQTLKSDEKARRDELVETSNQATLENYEEVPISQDKKQELVEELSTEVDGLVAGLSEGLSEDFKLAIGESSYALTDKKIGSVGVVMDQLAEATQDPKEIEVIEAFRELQKLRKKQAEQIPVTQNTDGLFRMLDRSSGMLKSSAKQDVRDEVANQINIKNKSMKGDVSTYSSPDVLQRIKYTLESRIDQINTLGIVNNTTNRSTQNVPYTNEELVESQTEMINLWAKNEELIEISEYNKNRPEAIAREINRQSFTKILSFIQKGVDSVPSLGPVVADSVGKIAQLKNEDNFADARKELMILEDVIYKQNIGIDISSMKDTNAYSYMRSIATISGSKFNDAYKNVLAMSQNVAPSIEHLLAIRTNVGALSAQPFKLKAEGLKKDTGKLYMTATEGGGGTGKTTTVAGFSSMILSELMNNDKGIQFLAPDSNKADRLRNAITGNFITDTPLAFGANTLVAAMNNPEIANTNVLVYDEAGLLSLAELRKIDAKLKQINKLRATEGDTPLVIMFLGDPLQMSKPGNIYTAQDAGMVRAPRLDFSFRATNQPLRSAEGFFTEIIKDKDALPKSFTYDSNNNGVRIYNKEDAFFDKIRSLEGEKVLITDHPLSVIPDDLKSMKILTPEQSMGEEYDYVFFYPNDVDIRNPEAHSGTQANKAFYTAFTRAKKGVIAQLDPELNIKSQSGVVPVIEAVKVAPTVEEETEIVDNSIDGAIDREAVQEELVPIQQEPIQPNREAIPESPEALLNKSADAEEDIVQPPAQIFSEYLKELSNNKDINVMRAASGSSDPSNRVARKVLNDPGAAEFFVTIGQIGEGRFKGQHGINGYDASFEKGGDNYGVFLEATIDGESTIIGALPDRANDEKFANQDIPDEGLSFAVSNSVISARTDVKPRLNKSTPPNNTFDPVKKSTYSLKQLADSYPGMMFSSVQIAMEPIAGKKGTRVKSGQAYIAISAVHNSVQELDQAMVNNIEDESLLLLPLSTKSRKTSTFEEVEVQLLSLGIDTLTDQQSPRSKQFTEMYWNREFNTHEGQPSEEVFESEEEALSIPLIKALWEVRDVHPSVQALLPNILKDDPEVDPVKPNRSAYLGRKQLMYDAILSQRRGGAASAKEQIYHAVKQQLNPTIIPQYTKGQSEEGSNPFAATVPIREAEAGVNHPASYTNSVLGDFASIDFGKEGLDLPFTMINKEVIDGALETPTAVNIPTRPVATSQTPSDVVVIETPQDIETGEDLITEEDNSGVQSLSTYSFLKKHYPGGSSVYTEEVINYFRRRVFDSVYKTIDGKAEVVDLNVALDGLRKEFTPYGKSKYKGDEVQTLTETERISYHKKVMGEEFNFLLSQAFPYFKQNAEGLYENKVSTTVQNIIGEDKENSKLGANMTEMMKSFLYGVPIITKDGDTYKAITKDGVSDSELGATYMTDGQIVEVVNEINKPGFRTEATSTETLKKALQASPNIYAHSLYKKLFSTDNYKVNGIENAGLSSTTSLSLHQDLDALAVMLLSSEVVNNKGVVFDESGTAQSKFPLGVHGAPNNLAEGVKNTIRSKKDFLTGFNKRKGIVTINGKTYELKSTTYSNAALSNLGSLLRDLGIPFNTAIFEGYKAISKKKQLPALKSLENMTINFIHAVKNDLNVKSTGAYTDLMEAVSIETGTPFESYQVKVNGNKSFRLRNSSPAYQLEQRLTQESDPDAILGSNLLQDKYKVVGFFTKDGIKTKDTTKGYGSLSKSEHAEIDVVYNFWHQVTKAEQIVAIPSITYADGSSSVIPMVKLPADRNLLDGDYVNKVMSDAIRSKRDYYGKLEQRAINKWVDSGLIKSVPNTIGGLVKAINKAKISPSAVATSGLQKELDYIIKDGKASFKKTLQDEIEFYNNAKFDEVKAKLRPEVAKMVKFFKDNDLNGKLQKNLPAGLTVEDAIAKYYTTWWAVSTDFRLATVGPMQMYKSDDATKQFIDMGKRGKLWLSPSTKQLFRESNWQAPLQTGEVTIRGEDVLINGEVIDRTTIYEGMKLNSVQKIAMVNDVEMDYNLPSGEIKSGHEIYDGATFVTPLTRIFQVASNGGPNGTAIYPVMKNITVSYNEVGPVGIKNAEFEITPELYNSGTKRLKHIHDQSLSVPFTREVQYAGKTHTNALSLLKTITEGGPVTRTAYDQLAKIMVATGNQDSHIHEVIPDTSVKMGAKSVTGIEDEYITQDHDIRNKGTQLNLVKDPHKKNLSATISSQMLNALAINYQNPAAMGVLRDALAEVTRLAEVNWKDKDLKKFFQQIVRGEGTNLKDPVGFAQALAAGPSERISLNSRMVYNRVVSAITSGLSKEGIQMQLPGGQFIIHPIDGLVDLARTKSGKVKVKKEGDGLKRTQLQHSEPTIGGKRMTDHPKYDEILDTEGNFIIDEKGNRQPTMAGSKALQEWLDTAKDVEPGFTEVMMSSAFVKDFGIEPGADLNKITKKFFVEQTDSPEIAERMWTDFNKALIGISTRIPATGKHSTNVIKVVGFIDASYNAIFPPLGMLGVKGADQDIDEEHVITWKRLKGIIPTDTKEDRELLRKRGASLAQIQDAITVNTIVAQIQEITEDVKNTVESNISVDSALDELGSFVPESDVFSNDSYVDFIDAEEQNHASQALVGVFANAQKGYQAMYEYYKRTGNYDKNNPPIAGLDGDFNEVWIKLAALINAATDGVKNRFLGPLGVTTENAAILSHLVIQGKSYEELFNSEDGYFVKKHKDDLQVLQDMAAYDYKRPKKFPKGRNKAGIPVAIAQDYNDGAKLTSLTQAIINRDLPNGTYELLRTQARWKRMMGKLGIGEFNLFRFLGKSDASRAKVQAEAEELYNPLNLINDLPHLKAYTGLLKFMDDTLSSKMSSIYPVIKGVYELQEKSVSQPKFKVMESFAFSLSVEQYLKHKNLNDYFGSDLTKPSGRNNFMDRVTKSVFPKLTQDHGDNRFVQHLSISDDGLLRVTDLNQLGDTVRAEVFAGFQQLSPALKQHLFYYSLITNGLSQSKESFAPLFEGDITMDYDNFLDNVMPSIVDSRLDDIVELFVKPPQEGVHERSIPFELDVDETTQEDTLIENEEPATDFKEAFDSGKNVIIGGASWRVKTKKNDVEIAPSNELNLSENQVTFKNNKGEPKVYTIRGTKVYNEKGVEVFRKPSTNRNKLFANLAVKQGRASIITHKDNGYLVNQKGAIMSMKTGRIMNWSENHGDRKAIMDAIAYKQNVPSSNKEADQKIIACIKKK